MAREAGEVWWGPAPHKASPAYRPWVIVSDSSHPFAAEESIVLAMTTRAYSASIEVPDSAWIRGGSNRTAYISPWYVTAIKHADFDNQQGTLAVDVVNVAIEQLHQYTPLVGTD